MSAQPEVPLICDLEYPPCPVCDCCERRVRKVRSSRWHGESKICGACFAIWYDEGLTDPDDIKARCLLTEALNIYPFAIGYDGDYRRITEGFT